MCCRQITSQRGPPTEPTRQQRVRGPDQGFSPVEGHSDAQVRMHGIVLGNRYQIGAMVRIYPYPPEKKILLFLYRPASITADMRSGVVAVVPLHRPISVTADVGSGVVAVGNRQSNDFR